jgi:hypothetical protein
MENSAEEERMKRLTAAIALILGLVFTAPPAVAQDSRPARLIVKGDVTCNYPTRFTDHQRSTDSYSFNLPEVDGPISATGSYTSVGNGYTLAGSSEISGVVRNDSELVVSYRQWYFEGEGVMNGPSPFVPSAQNPVVVPLDPGETATVSHRHAMLAEGTTCSGSITYRIDFERKRQVWNVSVSAERRLWHRNTYSLVNAQDAMPADTMQEHGFTFNYDLGARVTLERRRGAWTYREGNISRAEVNTTYHQQPELFTITGKSCKGCNRVTALAGQTLSGDSDGTTLTLYWPDIRPVATVHSVLAATCAPGPNASTCEGLKREGTTYSDEDEDVLQRMRGHVLKLTPGNQPFDTGTDSAVSLFQVHYDYGLVRVQ